jgi:hypothetical protein
MVVRSVEFGNACVIGVTAVKLRRCVCPCEKAGHRGVCQIWMWPGQVYYLVRFGQLSRARTWSLCSDCVEALRGAGHLAVVAGDPARPDAEVDGARAAGGPTSSLRAGREGE